MVFQANGGYQDNYGILARIIHRPGFIEKDHWWQNIASKRIATKSQHFLP